MDPNNLVLEISSDEDGDWNDHVRGVPDDGDGDDCNWFAELFGEAKENYGDDSEAVVVVSESEKPVKNSNSKSKSKLKLKVKLKSKSSVVDVDDDCVVLDKDPNAPVQVRNDDSGNGDDDSDEIVVVGEKGQVACRDYPHSRHLCIKFPFSTTPNESHCNQCYCYVCDSLAPCLYWGNGTVSTDHCHATDKDEFWIQKRKNAKNGCKIVQPVTQLTQADPQTPAPALAQPQNQIPNPDLIHAYHTSAHLQYPNFSSQYRNNILASRAKVHPDLASQFVLRAHQKYNLGSRLHRPVFKRHGPVRVGTTVNQTPYGSFRGNFGNLSRQQNYLVNRMLSRSSKSLGSLQPNAVNGMQPSNSMHHPFLSPTNTPPSVNPQPLLHQSQVSNHSNPNFQSHVNSNPFPSAMHFQQANLLPPSSFIPQPPSGQPSYAVQAEPVYPVPSKTIVDSPVVPASDITQNFSQGNQAQGPIVDSGFEDYGFDSLAGQDSTTPGSTNNSSLAAVSGGLADYQYDWIFDDQPIEPGFTDYSSDSAYIDTGPIFNF
ncbi:hypothetical protein SSX86_013127 [Deinandra increscens subsp. villosa]|uniref:Uncharacterized protein n=1 Tax=Deinandra increscens subsp. villosa TaxID=3103831 RepID=A0AAP0D5I8_9ASTR